MRESTVSGRFCVSYAHPVGGDVPHSHFGSPSRLADRRAGEEGMFFRDVLRMYDKCSTALKTHTAPAGAGVTIEVGEIHEVLAGRSPRLSEIKVTATAAPS